MKLDLLSGVAEQLNRSIEKELNFQEAVQLKIFLFNAATISFFAGIIGGVTGTFSINNSLLLGGVGLLGREIVQKSIRYIDRSLITKITVSSFDLAYADQITVLKLGIKHKWKKFKNMF